MYVTEIHVTTVIRKKNLWGNANNSTTANLIDGPFTNFRKPSQFFQSKVAENEIRPIVLPDQPSVNGAQRYRMRADFDNVINAKLSLFSVTCIQIIITECVSHRSGRKPVSMCQCVSMSIFNFQFSEENEKDK